MERARYSYIAPFYSQAKQIAWDYLKHYTKEVATKTSESGLSVDLFNDSRITLYGADNPDSFRGLYFDGTAIDEFGNCKPNLWSEILRPALSDRKGWAIFIGTPNGPNHFYDVWEKAGQLPSEWYRLLLKASESGIVDPGELAAMRQEMTEDEYQSEMECSWFASVRGSIFGQEMKSARIGYFPASPHVPCHYVFDIGYTDTTAIWRWQEFPDHIKVSLAYEQDSRPVQFFTDWLHAQRTSTGLKMGQVWLPHDAKAKTWQTGRSAVEQFISQGIRPRIIPSLSVQDGIQAARLMFKHLIFDEEGCNPGLKALKSYKRKFDVDRKAFMDKPDHDWASNFADSFRYLGIVAKLATAPVQEVHSATVTPLYPFSMDNLWEIQGVKSERL